MKTRRKNVEKYNNKIKIKRKLRKLKENCKTVKIKRKLKKIEN